jgi:hypothetical protein
VKVARLRKSKIVCSHSYTDFRSKANVLILLHTGHTLRGEHILKEYGMGGKPNLGSDVPTVEELI